MAARRSVNLIDEIQYQGGNVNTFPLFLYGHFITTLIESYYGIRHLYPVGNTYAGRRQ